MKGEDCIRRRLEIAGENYYLIVGKGFVFATVPYENRPAMSKERMVAETICREITNLMEELEDGTSIAEDQTDNR